jgi:hypothetical protein
MTRTTKLAIPALGLLLGGCTAQTFLYRIPDQPDSMAAFRQCMGVTQPVLLGPCLAAIPGVNSSGAISSEEDQKLQETWLAQGTGCRVLANYYFMNDNYIVQACGQTETGSAGTFMPPPNSYKDKQGNWHLRK